MPVEIKNDILEIRVRNSDLSLFLHHSDLKDENVLKNKIEIFVKSEINGILTRG